MKWKLAAIAVVLTLALAVALPLFAQEADDNDFDAGEVAWAGGWGHGDGPGKAFMDELALTKEQQKKLDDMRSTNRKEMIPLRAQVQVKQIELNELFDSDASISTINSKIDEIGKLRTDIAKRQAAHRIAMRQVLTPEQREIWDSRPKMMDMMRGRGKAMMERGAKMRNTPGGQGGGPHWRGRGL
jgi:Spy/CpxP family protein refolding chaperone